MQVDDIYTHRCSTCVRHALTRNDLSMMVATQMDGMAKPTPLAGVLNSRIKAVSVGMPVQYSTLLRGL